jgi:hypothetical protein
MKVYLATWLHEPSHGRALTKMKKKDRLLSYYHTIEKKNEFRNYAKTGRNDKGGVI